MTQSIGSTIIRVSRIVGIFLALLFFFHGKGSCEESVTITRAELDLALADAEEDLKMYSRLEDPGTTWMASEGRIYGAKPDNRGPIGGGKGYTEAISKGNYLVATLDQLLEALKKAKAGEVVYVADNAEIDCTVRVHIESLVIKIPAGVTLASGRGSKGSRGAMIFSDTLSTKPLIRAGGPDVRITGLRLRGPDPERRMEHHVRSFKEARGKGYYYTFPISTGVETTFAGLHIDNCELAGWSHAAIYLKNGGEHHIHHNYIHHNQYNGLGYGIVLDTAEALIDYNLFNFNRHSIAGTGKPVSGYEAAHNVELGESLSHCFDMHGGRDRKDGTDIAGTWMKIHHNTFRSSQTPVVIRGIPEKEAEIFENWFPNHTDLEENKQTAAVVSVGNTNINNNVYKPR